MRRLIAIVTGAGRCSGSNARSRPYEHGRTL